jgi:hypothetical protein
VALIASVHKLNCEARWQHNVIGARAYRRDGYQEPHKTAHIPALLTANGKGRAVPASRPVRSHSWACMCCVVIVRRLGSTKLTSALTSEPDGGVLFVFEHRQKPRAAIYRSSRELKFL